MGASLDMAGGIKTQRLAEKWRDRRLTCPYGSIRALKPPKMGDQERASAATGDGATYRVAGQLTIIRAATTQRELDELPDPLTIDLSEISRMDTVGAWLIYRTVRDRHAKIVGASEQDQALLDQVAEYDRPARVYPEQRPGFFRVLGELGAWVSEAGATFVGLLGFFGSTLIAFGNLIRRPRRFRLNAVVQRFDVVGVRALGIIGLMSFLIGIVVGQQGAVQLEQFGAEVYTINLIGRITVRELGTLMTAIMVAGRSGSAFAAQIGTMKLTEEVDAMRTIGVSPIEALVIPRIMAAVLMMPLLGFYSAIISIIGGAFIADLTLGIPFLTFIQRVQAVVPLYDVWVGLIKAPVFGLIVALAGCYQGMQVKGNSEEVGLRTTMAVVQAIFMVIVLDAFFAVFFTELGWA